MNYVQIIQMLRHSCRGRDFSGDGEHKFSSKMENARYFPMNLDLEEDVHYCIQRRGRKCVCKRAGCQTSRPGWSFFMPTFKANFLLTQNWSTPDKKYRLRNLKTLILRV